MNRFPRLNDSVRLQMLEHPQGVVDIVLDTDTYTEVDDQFALVYALKSKERLNVKAIYAAPFSMNERASDPGVGMELSYNEILRFLRMLNIPHENLVFKGSKTYLPDLDHPVSSPAVLDLIEKAKGYSSERPLYVVGIGASTNIASALLLCPDLVNRIVVVWLGGNTLDDNNNNAYNVYQDILAAQVLFNSGVPLVHVPCYSVTSHLLTSVPEMEACIGGKNEASDALIELVREYGSNRLGWAKVIWDIGAIAYLLNEKWAPAPIIHSPILTDKLQWSFDRSRHLMRNVASVDRNAIFIDLFDKLQR
ncbi:nucleoside hydrolase [Cohnella hongkongensis]|uniref:Nucleoside hydrolase n=1 Tax=Cohnella hongkongensis TaxID=178337 RepID=A0ABV9F6X4_9BACL